ncbi:hypothetical protein RUM44_007668 [Polyplax serrata]|uniref:Uncharacterized protein n=1 Tax=Polyplax serrata TaxID=468196 RepID=A0ABR1B814_POLSC
MPARAFLQVKKHSEDNDIKRDVKNEAKKNRRIIETRKTKAKEFKKRTLKFKGCHAAAHSDVRLGVNRKNGNPGQKAAQKKGGEAEDEDGKEEEQAEEPTQI